ncbi:MAG: FAD-dependent oxidoreductase [Roseburia sp.]|nr:FAD-dependent oxidoreductase [Roseburia sp.]
MYDIIIVGAGTAGLTAAVYGARSGKKVLVLEGRQPGGQIVNSPRVENYPGIKFISGFEFIRGLKEQAEAMGAEFCDSAAEQIIDRGVKKEVRTGEKNLEGRTVILAGGTAYRKLGLENEERLTGNGVSYCAVCDGAFYRGKDAAVVGGGNTALEDALFLADHCRNVFVIHRRDHFRGESHLVNSLQARENVEFVMESVVTSLRGEDRLESVIIRNTTTGVVSEKKIDGLFVAVGQKPDNERFADVVKLDESGYIQADETCETGTPGIFAAGDCRTKRVRQLVTAAADGAAAALAACGYLSG